MKILSARVGVMIILGLFSNNILHAQVNSWTNPVSGNWEDSKWSLGVLPGSGQDIMLTNAGWKAVAITTNTTESFPQTLTVNSITVSSPQDTVNTLFLNYSGLQTPLSAYSITVRSNSAAIVYDAAMVITNSLTLDGTFIEAEYSSVTVGYLDLGTFAPAVFNLTNSLLTLSGSSFAQETIVNHSVFNQHGGTNSGDIALYYSGEYDLADGGQVTGEIEMRGGNFNQWDGDLSCGFYFDSGIYQLAGGTVSLGDLHIPTQAPQAGSDQFNFVQTGGTNFIGNLQMDSCLYTLSGGTLSASGSITINAYPGINGEVTHSDFYQSGGTNINNGLNIYGSFDRNNNVGSSSYHLSGGILQTPTIHLDNGAFNQSGGLIGVTTLTLDEVSSYFLSSGTVQGSNLQVNGGSFFGQTGVFQQTGGGCDFDQMVFNNCNYNFGGGASRGDQFHFNAATMNHTGGTVTIRDSLVFSNAVWNEQTTGGQLNQLSIDGSTNFIFMPMSSACVLAFNNSSGMYWASNAVLQIENWQGSLYGGGKQQILFTNYEAPLESTPPVPQTNTLTAQQLSRIQFRNPAGLAPGTYPARLLYYGEIVPDSGTPLPLLVGLASQTNGLPQLQLMSDINNSYTIQASTNLINWDNILTLTNTSGTISFIDANATNYPRRFYRAELMP